MHALLLGRVGRGRLGHHGRRPMTGGAAGYQIPPGTQGLQQASYAEGSYAEGYYLECGANIVMEPLHTQLRVPALRLQTTNASHAQLPQDLRSSTLAFMETAKVMLVNAAEAYDKAITAAGFSIEEIHGVQSAAKTVLPVTFKLMGPIPNTCDAMAGAQQMQEAERLLLQVAQAMGTLGGSLRGLAYMEPPRQPLALSVLLQLLASDQVNLATSGHPVIQALFLLRTQGGQQQAGGAQGMFGRQQHHGGIGGRLGNLAQGFGRGRGGARFGGVQPAGMPGRGRFQQTGMSGRGGGGPMFAAQNGAMGMQNGLDHRSLAGDMAQEACTADLIEIQRLTEQLEEMRQWLLT